MEGEERGLLFLVRFYVRWFESQFSIEVVAATLVQGRATVVNQTLFHFLNLLHRVCITLR